MMILNRIYIITPLELEPLLTKVVSPTVSRLLETLHFFSWHADVRSPQMSLRIITGCIQQTNNELCIEGCRSVAFGRLIEQVWKRLAPDEKVLPLYRADY